MIKFKKKEEELKKKLGITYNDIGKQNDKEIDILYEAFEKHREYVLKKYWGV